MNFTGKQKTLTYTQLNNAKPEEVFPLLCPVREKDWLDGWNYQMVHSKSGLIEQDCVFTTPHHGDQVTVWQVTQYDIENMKIEFLRVSPAEHVVKINISLAPNPEGNTIVNISYQFTALNEAQNELIENELEREFKNNMEWWEKAINYYLEFGKMLKNSSVLD
ncbi:MAG: hypothetical protein AAFO07_21370 [Bacteroidota bacterium]